MAHETDYTYATIRPNQIRLFRFVGDEDIPSAVLEIFSVDAPLPPYRALSYTWGSDQNAPIKESTVQIGTQHLPILDSLVPFFQALRSKGLLLDGTWWWIDSICIDQKNNVERDEQVPRMKSIYEGAHSVIVWLGKETADSDRAIEFIHILEKTHARNLGIEELRRAMWDIGREADWRALMEFFLRRWWTRVWTVQEFVLPFDISFWCGEHRISRDAIFAALMVADVCARPYFKDTVHIHHAFSRIRAWKWYRVKQTQGKTLNLPLLALAAYFSSNEASDDRDRLYGLTGLSTNNHGLVVDYSRSVDEVYLQFAQSFIAQHRSLDVIAFASLYPATLDSALPSWVPDWRTWTRPLVVPLMVSQSTNEAVSNLRPPRAMKGDRSTRFRASRSKEAIYVFSGSSLSVRGYVLDTVDGLAGTYISGFAQGSGRHSRCLGKPSSEILTCICRCLVLGCKDRYLQEHVPIESYYDDFVSMCMGIVSQKLGYRNSPCRGWYEITRELLIDGRTFGKILKDVHDSGPSVKRMSQIMNALVQDSFYGRFVDTVDRMGLRLMTTFDGRLGMVGVKAVKGDAICILFGCNVPMVLRKMNDKEEFRVVGECYLDGFMRGEALELDGMVERTFCLV